MDWSSINKLIAKLERTQKRQQEAAGETKKQIDELKFIQTGSKK